MTPEQQDQPFARHPLFARLVVWQGVAAIFVGLNAIPFSQPWTHWTYLFLGCQVVLLLCSYRAIRRLERSVAAWIEAYFRKRER